MPEYTLQARVPHLYTKIRDKATSPVDFRRYAQRLMTVICEEALCYVSGTDKTVDTPVDSYTFPGCEVDQSNIVAISIIRAADSMLDVFMNIVPECGVGKILIQRNEETAEPEMYYDKVPPLAGKKVVLLDPMLATGGSAKAALEVLVKKGAAQKDITFVNVVTCPEGVKNVMESYPDITMFSGCVDEGLTAKKYIYPGLGDFGDRYFFT